MLFLDYFHFLTVACIILASATPSIADTDTDSLGLLASYNDSEDPDRLLDSGATTSTSNPYTTERPTGHVPVIKSHDPEEADDDFYIDEDEDDEEAINNEDEEGEVLNWVQNAVGSGIFDDVEYNQAILSKIQHEHSLVYPVQIRKNEVLGLDTHDQDRTKPGLHYYHTNLLFRMDSKKYKLKLSLNKDLISREMKQKTNIDSKTQIIEEGDLENCFYHGQVRKLEGSKVIVNTCNGISGIILLDNTTYAIQPLKPLVSSNETRWPHVMYKLPLALSRHKSANSRGMWKSFRQLHVGEFMRRRKIMTAMKNEFDVLGVTKRLQLGLIADYSVLQHGNMSVKSALVYLGQIANILDAVLQEVNIRVTLKYVELWNYGDLVSVESNARATLHNVFTYRQNALSFVDVDILHLLSGQRFDNEEIGMAIPDSICTQRAVSVSYDVSDFDRLQTANGVLHMIGHQFGLTEEPTDTCPCPYTTGCIMSITANGSISDHALAFSPCAKISLEEAMLGGLGTCMLEDPPRVFPYAQAFQEVFTQSCGNGRVERGEECDCLSPQECHLMDPCCNPDTCLLQPWATCRFGECCENCTVVPANYMCRLSKSECDVPEFCDGTSGYCPKNVTVQDGWPCKDGDGFCYQGLCQTYTDQCRNVWGPDARQADAKCYQTFNTAGRFNGHCGTNSTSNEYVKCDQHDVSCGLLHCEGGTTEPTIGKDNVFSTTTVNLAGVNYQCKIISSHTVSKLPHYGMVQDGTKCDNNSICINRHCVSLETITSATCPLGDNNIVCSGNGVCTNELTCYCNMNYTGHDCSQFRVYTTVIQPRLITSLISELERQTTPPPQVNTTPSSPSLHSTTVESPIITRAERSVSTIWLIIVLSSVAGGALLVLGCCMICYRRKSTVTFKKKRKKKKKNPSIFGSLTSFSSGNSKSSRSKEDSGDEVTNRIISFGNMPSYRADKIKKVMRQSAGSDTEHNTSASNRSSAEVKVVHTLPLAKAPERGILKKYPRTDAEHHDSKRRSRTPLCNSASGASKEMEKFRGSSAGGSTENDPMIPLSTLVHNYEEISDVECALDDDCLSCCSCDDDNEKVADDDDDDKAGDDEPCDCCSDNRDQQTQTDPDSPQRETPVEFPTSFDSLEGAKSKIVKLRNINELLKQIDAQFTNVLRESAQSGEDSTPAHEDTSPAGSGSEPEADRHCFYSPPTGAHYSGRGDSGTSPTTLPSPIQPVQPAAPPPAAHYRDPLRGPRHTTSTPKSTPPPQEHTRKAPDQKDPGSATRKSEEHLARHDPTWSSPTRTQRDSPGRCSPIQRDSPPRMGSPIVSRIPECPTRPAPELSSRKKSPERSISSKYSPKTVPHSPKTASRNLNNSSNNKDSCHKVEPPPVIAVPYRGAKSGSPTPQARKRLDHCTPPGSPKSSASGRASPNPRSLGSGSKSEPSPTTRLGLGNPSGSNNTSTSSGSGSNGSSSAVPTPTDRQGSPSVDKTKPTSTGVDGKPNRSPHPAKPSTSLLSKLTQPLFDSKAFRRRGSHSIDGTSNSEGYHSDRADLDNEDAVIVREIPGKKPADLPFMPNPNGSYTRAPGSPGSPEDINV